MITPKTDLGHWHCDFIIPYPRPFGFLYVIVNKLDHRRYIGCKQFCFQRKSQRVESDWRTYTSSSKNLKADIKKTRQGKLSLRDTVFTFIKEFPCLLRNKAHFPNRRNN